jgi:prophage antirepressor-like protein
MKSRGSNAIQVFVFPKTKHKVRDVIDKHGNPWWVAKDVCVRFWASAMLATL